MSSSGSQSRGVWGPGPKVREKRLSELNAGATPDGQVAHLETVAFGPSLTVERLRFGNGLDWQQAEESGLINPVDFVPGISIKRKSLAIQKDFALNAKLTGMPNIIFSHKKHTVWNGCELCHPEIFVGVKKGETHYSMVGIFEGKYCGACHNTVAFPLMDCQRCHSTPVQP